MRFLFLTQYYPPEIGAPQTRLAAMVRELQRCGHTVEVVTALPSHPVGRIFAAYRGRFYVREEVDGVRVHRVWLYAATGAGFKRIVNYLSFAATCVWGLLRCFRPDYIFVESPPLFLSLPAYVASRVWRAPFIFNVADLWPDSVREMGVITNRAVLGVADWLESWSYRKAGFVNAVTEGIAKVLVTQKGVPSEKVLFLPNGVDTTLFRPQAADSELQTRLGVGDRPVFVYAGTHGYAQGLEVVIEAAARLPQDQAFFLFVGDGPLKSKLRELSADRRLVNVAFADSVPLAEMPRYFALARASLVTLRKLPLFEGARPSKMFPSLAAGVPVVYSGEGEGARLIEMTGAGVVVPPEDADALAAAIDRLARDSKLAKEMGKNGRTYVEENLSWRGLVQDWLAHLAKAGLR